MDNKHYKSLDFEYIQIVQHMDSSSSLEGAHPELFSNARRSLNSLKEPQSSIRKASLVELERIFKEEILPAHMFEQLMHMGVREILKCWSDKSQACRQLSVKIILQALSRCANISSFLPYVFSALVDRTNCTDLQGVLHLPEKMRPNPNQKPHRMTQLLEQTQQIRVLYLDLLSKVISLVQEQEIRKYLDDIISILRVLIMDPAGVVQERACAVLELFCKQYKLILLHYTEIMGRAILLPLISKKSKIRIAGLNCLTAIFWCGLWKYNAFVFENLIGFRDPNSVPIKDFYQPSHNINYLATFINDPNPKVRVQFLKHIYTWTCQLDDKYDHHGKLVPYIMSGLFDEHEEVRLYADKTIKEIGRQIEIEKQKEFRQNKQFAIDAAWTWDGKLVNLPLPAPLTSRPTIGSRFFIRGHIRKFLPAIYKEIHDINYQTRVRAGWLLLFGCVFTENYLTQYLDVLLPHMFTAVLPREGEQQGKVEGLVQQIIFYIGRYCEVSAWIHIARSALKGQLIGNQSFMRAALRGVNQLVSGCFQSIPAGSLQHKYNQIASILTMLSQTNTTGQIYKGNCGQGKQLLLTILTGLKQKASRQQQQKLMEQHCPLIIKLISSCFYQQHYSLLASAQDINQIKPMHTFQSLSTYFNLLTEVYPQYQHAVDEYLRETYMNPPALMDCDWKCLIVLHHYMSQTNNRDIFSLIQDVISESLSINRSVSILNFTFRYCAVLFDNVYDVSKLAEMHVLLYKCMENFLRFKPIKKVPIYEKSELQQKLKQQQQQEVDPLIIVIQEDPFIMLFKSASQAFRSFYLHKVQINPKEVGRVFISYLSIFNKFCRNKVIITEGIKTVWSISERAQLTQSYPQAMMFLQQSSQNKVIPMVKIIDFLVQRLQTLDAGEKGLYPMVFSSLINLLKCFPVIPAASTPLPCIYPHYPQLIDKLIKYAMDEKDIELRDKYRQLLVAMCKKLRPWFILQARISQESRRFIKAKLITQILSKSQ